MAKLPEFKVKQRRIVLTHAATPTSGSATTALAAASSVSRTYSRSWSAATGPEAGGPQIAISTAGSQASLARRSLVWALGCDDGSCVRFHRCCRDALTTVLTNSR